MRQQLVGKGKGWNHLVNQKPSDPSLIFFSTGPTPLPKQQQALIDEATADYVITGKSFYYVIDQVSIVFIFIFFHLFKEARAIHTVTRKAFRKLLKVLNPRARPMGTRRLRNLINKAFLRFKRHVIKEAEEVDHICLTADLWSSRRRGFLGVTAHWLTRDLKRKSYALACQRFKGTNICYSLLIKLLLNL